MNLTLIVTTQTQAIVPDAMLKTLQPLEKLTRVLTRAHSPLFLDFQICSPVLSPLNDVFGLSFLKGVCGSFHV